MKKFFLIIVVIFLGMIFVFRDFLGMKSEKMNIPNTASENAKIFSQKAKNQIGIVTKYDFSNGYYGDGGYPPPDTGVCSDVIWRAFQDFGIDLKAKIDEHMQKNPKLYSLNFDSNINFRRVKNIDIYLKHTAKILTTKIIPWNQENLAEWQEGDIVVFDALPPKNLWHIGIILAERDENGVPFMLDNHGYGVDIRMTPLDWPTNIVWHYRYFHDDTK